MFNDKKVRSLDFVRLVCSSFSVFITPFKVELIQRRTHHEQMHDGMQSSEMTFVHIGVSSSSVCDNAAVCGATSKFAPSEERMASRSVGCFVMVAIVLVPQRALRCQELSRLVLATPARTDLNKNDIVHAKSNKPYFECIRLNDQS